MPEDIALLLRIKLIGEWICGGLGILFFLIFFMLWVHKLLEGVEDKKEEGESH